MSRLLIELVPLNFIKYSKITNIHLQGFVYNLLKDTRYNFKHDENGFKYFTYSNLFPVGDFKPGYVKKIIISSPINELINTVYYKLKTVDQVELNKQPFIVRYIKKLKEHNHFQGFKTGTPICLYSEKGDNNHFFSFKDLVLDYDFFFRRLKENALKKYNNYTGMEYWPEEDLFISFEFRKEVAHSLRNKQGYRFLVIGSQWDYLECNPNIRQDFYKFIYDVGLGEKNSLGYGFLNML